MTFNKLFLDSKMGKGKVSSTLLSFKSEAMHFLTGGNSLFSWLVYVAAHSL